MRQRETKPHPLRSPSPSVAAARGFIQRADDEPAAPRHAASDGEARETEPASSVTVPAHERRFGLRNERGHLLATGTVESLRGMRERTQPPGEVWTLVRLARRCRGA
jgi:hypothetical protein